MEFTTKPANVVVDLFLNLKRKGTLMKTFSFFHSWSLLYIFPEALPVALHQALIYGLKTQMILEQLMRDSMWHPTMQRLSGITTMIVSQLKSQLF